MMNHQKNKQRQNVHQMMKIMLVQQVVVDIIDHQDIMMIDIVVIIDDQKGKDFTKEKKYEFFIFL